LGTVYGDCFAGRNRGMTVAVMGIGRLLIGMVLIVVGHSPLPLNDFLVIFYGIK
jgi:hypothetical protein